MKLLRDHIHECLYTPKLGYFMKHNHQLGLINKPIQYRSLQGIHSYLQLIGQQYPPNAFLTPVQIFQPWYGHSIAHFILSHSKPPLKILQIGGGTGTAALSILDYYKRVDIHIYNSIQYYLVQISPSIAKIASNRLKEAHPLLWNKQLKVINQSVLDWNIPVLSECFILGFQVLDNMPHDRIWKKKTWNKQSMITDTEEIQVELSDPVIQEVLHLWNTLSLPNDLERQQEYQEGFIYNIMKWWKNKQEQNCFLPTGTFLMLKHLKEFIKYPRFIFSDFDFFPNSKISGINAPIVATKGEKSDQVTDFSSFLMPKYQADIFFPVDFRLIKHMIYEIFEHQTLIYKSHKFMKQFGRHNWTQTKTGYKPLQDDFHNTSFLVSYLNK